MPLAHFPLAVHDREGDVFVGGGRFEPYDQRIFAFTAGLQVKLWCLSLIEEVRVENVELVSLDDFWRWVLRVEVDLIVLVPLVALLDAVVVARLAGHVRDRALTDDSRLVGGSGPLLRLNYDVRELDFVLAEALVLNLVEQGQA